jgi:hypothetical protein
MISKTITVCFFFPFNFFFLHLYYRLIPDDRQFIAKAFLEKDYEALKATTASPQPIEDVAMSDANEVKIEIQHETENETEKPEVGALKSEDTPVSQPAPETKPEDKGDQVPVKEETEKEKAPESFPGTNEDLTFDSVLNDGGTNDFGLSLDFNDDDMGNQAFLSGSNFAASGDKSNTPQPAPTGGDAFDMELQKTEGDEGSFPGQDNGNEDFMGPAESNFDDLFLDTDNFGENGGDFNQLEGDSLMNVNELDDNWFN